MPIKEKRRHIVLTVFTMICLILLIFSTTLLFSEILNLHTNLGTYSFDISDISFIDLSGTVSVEEIEYIFSKIPIKLLQNYPNPFMLSNMKTTIKFKLTEPGKTIVSIFNVKGQKVVTLIQAEMQKGEHEVVWDGKDNQGKIVNNGIYFYKVVQNNQTKIKKIIVIQ